MEEVAEGGRGGEGGREGGEQAEAIHMVHVKMLLSTHTIATKAGRVWSSLTRRLPTPLPYPGPSLACLES